MKEEMQHLLVRLKSLQDNLKFDELNSLLKEEYEKALKQFSYLYKLELENKLRDIYDEYFEDDSVQSVLSYLSDEGVLVYGEDFPGVKGTLHLFMNPMRLEFVSKNKDYRASLWNAA